LQNRAPQPGVWDHTLRKSRNRPPRTPGPAPSSSASWSRSARTRAPSRVRASRRCC